MTPRRLALAIVVSLSLFAGCNPASKVIGTWDMQTETPAQPAESGAPGATYIPPALLNAMKPKMNIEFKQNGNCVVEAYAGGEKAEGRGKWKYVKTEKDVVVLKVKMQGLSDEEAKTEYEEKEIRVRFIDYNNIETVPLPVANEEWDEHTKLTFKRRDF
jgi:hypothetical protein